MKSRMKRITSLMLAVALSVTMLVVSAPSASAFEYVPQPSEWNGFQASLLTALEEYLGISSLPTLDDVILPVVGPCSREELQECADHYNSWIVDLLKPFDSNIGNSFSYAVVTESVGDGILRLIDARTNEWIVNTKGEFPFCYAEGDGLDEVGANTPAPPSVSRNKFIDVKNLNLENIQLVVLTEDALAESAKLINDDGITCTMVKASINGTYYWVIMRSGGTSAAYYCNSAGQPYVAIYEDTVTNLGYDYIVNNNTDNSIVVEDSQIINIEDGEFTLIDDNGDKVTLTIDNLIFDTSTKNYTLNAYNTVEEGDNYYYTYYTYNITYNITNTYITYIGSNDAYEKEEYEFYYQLPDGRSSADLTADEVAGMSFEFHDVVNYAKSATDVSVRALYHFDGDLEDSSYFSTQGAFTWTEGASITYMEAPTAFDGTLYLDGTSHSFDVTLPSNMGSGDATVQFRHYQASEPDTVSNIENSVSIGGTPLLSWDEQNLYYGSTKIASLPVGTWSEIALVRNSNTLYIYLNGLCVHSVSMATVWGDTLTFTLGDSSRAYTMLDELRVLNFAMVEGGNSYTPTSVPFDSNLVLVLPDSARPIADEYWEWDTTITPKMVLDLTNADASVPAGTTSSTEKYYNRSKITAGDILSSPDHSVFVGADSVTFSADVSGSSLTENVYYYENEFCFERNAAIMLTGATTSQYMLNGTYTYTLVDANGISYSLTFESKNTNRQVSDIATFDWGYMYYERVYDADSSSGYRCGEFLVLSLNPGTSLDVVYFEVVPGSSANVGHEKVTCIYPESEMQPNTAAVQSTIPVNGYTVGGVRPTLPSRGDVWFPVSDSRITACYIYNGSMWEEVGCRYYTGSRWIPIYAFDLVTLEDLYDIADAADAIVPITSESGFWRWWQLQWLDFRSWFEGALSIGGGSGTGVVPSDPDDTTFPGVSDSNTEDDSDDGYSFLDLLVAVKDGVWKITIGIVETGVGGITGLVSGIGQIGSFFDAFDSDSSDNVLGILNYEGADIWD